MHERCYVDVSTPLPNAQPIARLQINPHVTSVQVSAELNSGYTDITIGIDQFPQPQGLLASRRSPLLEQPGEVPPNAHITLSYDGAPCGTGRAVRFNRPGGQLLGFAALGYGVAGTVDDVMTSAMPGDPVSDNTLLHRAIAEAAPFLSTATGLSWIAPTTRHNPAELRFATPRDALELVSTATGQPWVVYDDRAVQLLPSTPPSEPDYLVPFDASVTWDEDWHEVYTHVLLIVTDERGQERVIELPNPELSIAALGFTRRYPLRSQAAHEESAILVAHQWLREHARPAISASINRAEGRGLERTSGGLQRQHLVRPGEWVQVGDQPMQRITRTTWDGWRETLGVTLGKPARGNIMAVIQQMNQASRALVNTRDPLSLGRAR